MLTRCQVFLTSESMFTTRKEHEVDDEVTTGLTREDSTAERNTGSRRERPTLVRSALFPQPGSPHSGSPQRARRAWDANIPVRLR